VPVDVGAEDDALGLRATRHENAEIAVHLDPDFLQLAAENPEKGVLRADHGGLPHETLEGLQEIEKVEVLRGTSGGVGLELSGNAQNRTGKGSPP
jgi:hypothetical protein